MGQRGKFGEDPYVQTEHNGLLCALSRVHFRTAWWEYNFALSAVYCQLCSREITPKMGVTALMFQLVLEHERQHIECLGREKVAAAEALRMILDANKSPIEQSSDWLPIIQDVWGFFPNATVPIPATMTTTKGPRL